MLKRGRVLHGGAGKVRINPLELLKFEYVDQERTIVALDKAARLEISHKRVSDGFEHG